MDQRKLDALREVFAEVAQEDGSIDASELAAALQIGSPLFARRVFEQFDGDGSGRIGFEAFLAAVARLSDADPKERIRFAFRIHDRNGSGAITRDELDELIRASLAESGLSVPPEQVAALVEALVAECDADDTGCISEAEFTAALDRWPALRDAMAVGPVSWLTPRERPAAPEPAVETMRRRIRNQAAPFLLVIAWVGLNVGLFWDATIRYADSNAFVQIARGCGACLNVNGALILVPMMRKSLTHLRRSAVGHLLPVDEAIDFHRLLGNAMFAFGAVHAAAHLLNYSTLPGPIAAHLLGTKAGVTGLLLLGLFGVMTAAAQDFVRRKGYFELFYFTHLLYIGWFTLMVLHGPRFWKFALVPVALFAADRAITWVKRSKPTTIRAGNVLASGVTELVIQRPAGFDYEPGSYVFVRVPPISKHEWHPFTISSAPEIPDVLTLHIRSAGNWTRKIHEHYRQVRRGSPPAPVYLEGPYGTPAVHIFQAKVAVLIGAGIGVTPFASILKSLLERKRSGAPQTVEKVWFYWINREQRSFEWFAALLAEIEANNADGFFEIRIFLTGMKARTDLASATLHIAMDLHHAETRIDLVTGLQTRTRAARPDWDAEIAEIVAAHPGVRPQIFLCGAPGLAAEVRRAADRADIPFRREHF